MATFKPKENARPEFLLMVMESWTYNRMTVDEKNTCLDKIITATIKGRFLQRWTQLQAVFSAYLDSIGYSGAGWRDAQNAPTEQETSEAVQDTACTDTEPQEGTERRTEQRGKRANYTGAALDTFERIHPTSTYIPNQLYKTAEGHLYYINTHGYMHILTGSREKSADGTKYYCIIDNLLTTDNHLHESCKTFYTTAAAAREKVKEMEQTAIEATESAENTADDTTPTAGDTEPQRATETAQKTTDMETFKKEYSRIYSHLYEHEGQPGVDATRRKYSRLFDESWEDIKDIVKAFCQKSGDLLTSDRQCAAFMKALETVGTPQDAPQGTESTTGEETPTDGEKTPYGATDEATTGGKNITTDGTTPANDPRQPDGATTGDTDGGNRITGGKNITPPRTACENAPQGAETGEGVQTTTARHKTPPRGKYKTTHARRSSEKFVRKSGFLPAHCISPELDRRSYPHRGISERKSYRFQNRFCRRKIATPQGVSKIFAVKFFENFERR